MSQDWLRERRAALGITQRELARRLGVHVQTIAKAERGATEMSERLRLQIESLGMPRALTDGEGLLAGVAIKAQARRPSDLDEVGTSGLFQYGGFVGEEFRTELKGRQGAKVYREMTDNSAALGAGLRAIKLLIRQVRWRVEPFASDDEHQADADFVEECLGDMEYTWSDTLAEIFSMITFGYAPLEVVYKRRLGYQPEPSIDPTQAQGAMTTVGGWPVKELPSSKYDDGRIGWRKFALRAQETVWRWEFGQHGEILGMHQQAPPYWKDVLIPAEKLLLFRPDVHKNNPEGVSPLRTAYFDWYYFKGLTEVESITAERDGVGIPVAYIPADCMRADAPSNLRDVHTRVRRIVENLRVDEQHGVVLPMVLDANGKELVRLELLSSPGTRQLAIDPIITRHETRMLMVLLTDFILLGHEKVGARSLSEDKTGFFAQALSGWLGMVADVINLDAIPKLMALNGRPPSESPKLAAGQVETQDLKKLGDYVTALAGAGMPLFPDEALEEFLRDAGRFPKKVADEEDVPASVAQEEPTQKRRRRMQPRVRAGRYSTPDPGAQHAAEALAVLRDRQRVGEGDSVAHGFDVERSVPWGSRGISNEDLDAAPIKLVALKDLTATQPHVRRDRVRGFVENPSAVLPGQRSLSGAPEDFPVVVRHRAQQLVYDGHHRLAALRLSGATHTMARVVPEGVSKGDPDQPRVPAGVPEGGQFASGSNARSIAHVQDGEQYELEHGRFALTTGQVRVRGIGDEGSWSGWHATPEEGVKEIQERREELRRGSEREVERAGAALALRSGAVLSGEQKSLLLPLRPTISAITALIRDTHGVRIGVAERLARRAPSSGISASGYKVFDRDSVLGYIATLRPESETRKADAEEDNGYWSTDPADRLGVCVEEDMLTRTQIVEAAAEGVRQVFSARTEPSATPTQVHVHLPAELSATLSNPPAQITINVPEQGAPIVVMPEQPVTVNVPEQRSPNVIVNVPEQAPPVVSVQPATVTMTVPTPSVSVNVEKDRGPQDIRIIETPDTVTEHEVERDQTGRLKRSTSVTRARKRKE